MKRRSFLSASLAAGASTMSCSGPSDKDGKTSTAGPSALDADGTLAGKTLAELRKQYRYDLFTDYVPFQHKYVVDKEYGGFMLHTDWDGPPITTEKTAWYEGRGTWSMSFLYNKLDPDPRHIEAARRSVEFIMKHEPRGDVFWPNLYTREGKADAPPNTDLYGDIFIANGLQEFSKAPGNEKWWDKAKEIMMKCVRMYDKPGYYANVTKSYLGEDAPPLDGGARLVGHWFILLRLATQMLENRDDPEVEAVATRCVDAVMNHHYNPDIDLINEVICHDFSRPDNDLVQHVGCGHNFEVLWMTLYEAVRRRDKNMFDLAARHFKRNFDVAWDDVYGGLFRSLEHVDKNLWDADVKGGWVQMEAMNGLMCIIEHTGADWAKEYFGKIYTWTMDRFPLKPYGLPLWQDYTNRRAIFVKSPNGRRAENLHHPRQLMLNLLAVERIAERNGKISGIFS